MKKQVRDHVVCPAAVGVLKYQVILECSMEFNREEKHEAGYGGMYDPSRLNPSDTLAAVLMKWSQSTIEGVYDTIQVKVTQAPPEIQAAHNRCMEQVKAIHEKNLSEKQKKLLAEEAELRAKLSEIEKIKSRK